ncbi:DndE family protein [Mucilaginibacter sp. SG564]|uniref:DndE family protein n=1 Tax=Mucilaginibacter sp. SG564 TaxID=2587022 RepID=UPI0015517941|nr:DndE family protein [Mucilaginibacter sp. SG564]NOW96129.1 DNA sulfur modification protein DndE [Mucilaginibacter sp. SG564]
MFSNIKTAKANKEIVTKLTNKLNLGSENIVARMALSYSLTSGKKFNISDILDSGGKEYSMKVLFGELSEYYISFICVHYLIHKTNKDVSKYIKMHIDDGLVMISSEIEGKNSISGTDFIINEVEKGLRYFEN